MSKIAAIFVCLTLVQIGEFIITTFFNLDVVQVYIFRDFYRLYQLVKILIFNLVAYVSYNKRSPLFLTFRAYSKYHLNVLKGALKTRTLHLHFIKIDT